MNAPAPPGGAPRTTGSRRPTRAAGPRRPPRARGRRLAIALAIAMHLLLIGLLFFGLNWQSRPPEAVQAELWTAPPAAVPVPAPRPEPEPSPPPAPAPPLAAPRPEPMPAKAEPDIKAEQARRDAQRREAERREAERKAERKDAERKDAERRAEERRAEERRRAAEQKAAEERRQREDLARRDAQRKAADEAQKKAADEARRREEQARRDADAAEARRVEDIRRLQNQAGPSGTPGDAAVRGTSAGGRADASYGARVAAAIRSNTTYQLPANLEGNPKAVFSVQLRPDCSVVAVRLRRSSGVPAWDQAAERGIERTDPFPRPTEGACQSELEIVRGPRDER